MQFLAIKTPPLPRRIAPNIVGTGTVMLRQYYVNCVSEQFLLVMVEF